MQALHEDMLLSDGLWKRIKELPRNGQPVLAAIAYYSFDHLKLQRGDLLVVNASLHALSSGSTNGALLLRLFKRGVVIHNIESLHAKVISIDKTVIVGSANSSKNSEKLLTEAAVFSRSLRMRSSANAFIEEAASHAPPLSRMDLERMAAIKVVRATEGPVKRTRVPLGDSKVWWLCTGPLSERLQLLEQEHEARGMLEAQESAGNYIGSLDVIRYSDRSNIASRLKLGDTVVQAYSVPFGDEATTLVQCPASIKHIQKRKGWVRFYLQSLMDEWYPTKYSDVRNVNFSSKSKIPTARSSKELSSDDLAQLQELFEKKAAAKQRRRSRPAVGGAKVIRC